MTSEDIKNREWTEEEIASIRRIAERQAAGDDSQIDYSDIPPSTDAQLAAAIPFREFRRLVPIKVRLDPKVIEWLKSKGEDYPVRINDILLNLMEAEMAAKK